MSDNKTIVGITQGDINGIGLEVILKTFSDPRMLEVCTPILFSSQKTVSYHRKALGMEELNYNILREDAAPNPKRLNIINCYEEEVNIDLGKSTESGGKYALKSIEAACMAIEKGQVDVLVTGPINKHNIQSGSFSFPGHTEYLEKRFGKGDALMLMTADKLRVGVVSGHIPIQKVPSYITIEKILSKLRVLNKTLLEDFGIRKSKIAILGLNPHAGDNGTIGNEELEIIIPAIKKAQQENIMVLGPFSADGFFGSPAYTKFDAVLAMYHDQGLIPFKTLSFNSGVNLTAGLSIIRTSPDHGTAYELAGKNQADEESFRTAVYLACDIFKTRKQHEVISDNPLKVSPMKRER